MRTLTPKLKLLLPHNWLLKNPTITPVTTTLATTIPTITERARLLTPRRRKKRKRMTQRRSMPLDSRTRISN